MSKIRVISCKGTESNSEVSFLVGQVLEAPVSAYRLSNDDGEFITIDAEDCEVID